MLEATPQDFGRVLSSMCTEPCPPARRAAERFLATNPGDPGTYPEIARLEQRAVDLLGDITELSAPAGYVATGGTEANIQAVRMARNRAETDDPNVVAPESAHFSFHKGAEMLDVEIRTTPLSDARADPGAMAEAIDEETALVVAVAGSTEFGRVDPIPALADLAADAGALCHVDAAWGGFHLPFTDHDWSFADAPIDSMTIDPHKAGQAPIPAGGLLARDETLLDTLEVETPYLETSTQVTLAGTRSGAGVAGALAAMETLWPDGYRDNHERAMANAEWLATEFRDRGYDIVDPELPLVAADVSQSIIDALRRRGWRISRTGAGDLRIVCMPHVTRSMLRSFVADLDWY
ncbi:MAG: tyrosine decarboxylase MfnA [Halococcoides sp.]